MPDQDAFVEAARLGNIEIVRDLLQQHRISLDGADSQGVRALSESIRNGQDDVACLLLNAGAEFALRYGLLSLINFLVVSLNYMYMYNA